MKLATGSIHPAVIDSRAAEDRTARTAELAVVVALFAMFFGLLSAVLAQMFSG